MEAVAAREPEIQIKDRDESAPRVAGRLSYLSTAEIAPCTCPEWCERDHDRD